MATFVAITHHQQKYIQRGGNAVPTADWQVLAVGDNREEVESRAIQEIGDIRTGYGTDLVRDTKHKNLRIVSKTKAKRVYKINFDNE